MAKQKTVYVCNTCGAKYPKWQGQCGECGEWQTLVEEVEQRKSTRGTQSTQGTRSSGHVGKVVMLSEVEVVKEGKGRILTGSSELDRVLGGGIVPGSVVLVGGEPGIGKSTLLTQLAMRVGGGDPSTVVSGAQTRRAQDDTADLESVSAVSNGGMRVLYVCGEESTSQVGLRISRLGESLKLKAENSKLGLMSEMDVDVVVETAKNKMPSILIIDSIQTLFTTDLTGMAGSVGQVRECAFRLIELAKSTDIAILLVGHVTKEGTIAGPKVLEHMVDAVLVLEGDRKGLWRLLRSAKNRFGPVDEVGVFSMEAEGMTDVTNPSGAFLEERQVATPGSAVVVVMEGSRPVLIEVQALAVKSQLAMPRRVAQGISLAKLQVLAAVLQKHCHLPLGESDLFVNVVGGLKVTEPAADLGIAMALASSSKGKVIPEETVFVGEVGLLGEVRRVAHLERRVKEAKKLGYARVVGPGEFKSVWEVVKGMVG